MLLTCMSSTDSLQRIDRKYIKDHLITIKDKVDENDNENLDTIIELLSKHVLLGVDKRKILKLRKPTIQIVTQCKYFFNNEPIEETNYTTMADAIEAELDKHIERYNFFTGTHPMMGVTYDGNSQYLIQYGSTSTHNTNLHVACTTVQELMTASLSIKKRERIISNKDIIKKSCVYKDYCFIPYWYKKEMLFDIHHIIFLLNMQETCLMSKYNTWANTIKYYCWHQNQFGGYVLRELISEKNVYQIILSSRSEISLIFRNSIIDIPISLRQCDKENDGNNGNNGNNDEHREDIFSDYVTNYNNSNKLINYSADEQEIMEVLFANHMKKYGYEESNIKLKHLMIKKNYSRTGLKK